MQRLDGHSRDFALLSREMRIKIFEVDRICDAQGVDMLWYCTWRSAATQARLYRQSRPFSEIEAKAEGLMDQGFENLGRLLLAVGPQSGPHRTNAAPGESWHNYLSIRQGDGLGAEAVDGVPISGGKLPERLDDEDWKDGSEEFQVYAAACKQVGLRHASTWRGWKEWPHCQNSGLGNPLHSMSPDDPRVLALTRGWEFDGVS